MRMKSGRCKVAALFVVVGSLCAYGCGGGSGSGHSSGGRPTAQKGSAIQATSTEGALRAGVVASIEGDEISEATLNHWVAVQAVTDYEAIPKRAVPSGVIPDPPLFRACIAYQRAGGPSRKPSSKVRTNEELLAACESSYQTLRDHVLSVLISFKWWEAEVKAAGVSVSEQEVRALFARFRKEQYGSPLKYQRYLRLTGQSLADEYLRMRMDLNTLALLNHFQSEGTPQLAHYAQDFAKEWAAKTSCQPSDVVPNCREYKGRVEPEARI